MNQINLLEYMRLDTPENVRREYEELVAERNRWRGRCSDMERQTALQRYLMLKNSERGEE